VVAFAVGQRGGRINYMHNFRTSSPNSAGGSTGCTIATRHRNDQNRIVIQVRERDDIVARVGKSANSNGRFAEAAVIGGSPSEMLDKAHQQGSRELRAGAGDDPVGTLNQGGQSIPGPYTKVVGD